MYHTLNFHLSSQLKCKFGPVFCSVHMCHQFLFHKQDCWYSTARMEGRLIEKAWSLCNHHHIGTYILIRSCYRQCTSYHHLLVLVIRTDHQLRDRTKLQVATVEDRLLESGSLRDSSLRYRGRFPREFPRKPYPSTPLAPLHHGSWSCYPHHRVCCSPHTGPIHPTYNQFDSNRCYISLCCK